MPDLRDELGRLADFVGEPVGLDGLAAARRRRERRRRSAGLAGGLAVLLIGALIAVQLGRGGGSVTLPGDTNTPAPVRSASRTVWPENAVNGDSPAEVQASLDDGDDSLLWRAHPERVVQRFGEAVLGRSMRIVDTEELDDGVLVKAWPCPAGEQPVGLSCDVTQGDPIAFHLIQPARTGEGGIWSIASVNSMPLGVTVLGDPATDEVREGDDATFDVGGLPASASAHYGVVVTNGCNVVTTGDNDMRSGSTSLAIPSVGFAVPSCVSPAGGYAFLFVTDDTTLPSPDPINEPTAIEFPWISVVPFALVTDDEAPSSTPSATKEPSGVVIPIAVDAPTTEGCPTLPATEFEMTLRNLHLVGCGRWASGSEITIHFTIADSGVPAGLMLFREGQCSDGVCAGQPSLDTKVDTGSQTVRFGPVDAGGYILLDPVHPMTSAVAIDVG